VDHRRYHPRRRRLKALSRPAHEDDCVIAKVALSSGTSHAGARPARAPVVLGQRASLLVSAGVVAHTLWASAAPAMAYRLYAEEWHLSHTVTTGIFAIYPAVVVAVLIAFGDISDHIGRRATMLVGHSLQSALRR
jgi:hypothetical protein